MPATGELLVGPDGNEAAPKTAASVGESGNAGGPAEPSEIERELWVDWLKVLSEWPANRARQQSDLVRDLVRRGVPANLRGQIWRALAGGGTQQVPSGSEQYQALLRQTSSCEKLIQRDIARTYPENDYFKDESGPGQEGLFNVIRAYSVHDPEVGYCQGSAFIVGLLLLQLSEEESFQVLCRIMHDYRMREIYKPSMAELGLCIYQLECLVQELLPELYMHFQSQNFYTSMYSSSWFLTLFTANLPLHLAYRVMDLFFSEGLDMVFRLSIAILQICRDELLRLDMEGLLRYFQKEMPSRIECDPEHLIKCACQVRYDSKRMKKLSKDYTAIKAKEQEEAIEFRRLRTENRLLQDRLRTLEIESKELADKLIKGQVCRAQEAEENFIVKRELSQLRNSDQQHKAQIEALEARALELQAQLQQRTIVQTREQAMMCEGIQEELVAVKLREAENHFEMEQLKRKINEQELYIKSLRENVPEDPIAQLQEELSAAKLREAEANFAMKELRTKLQELQALWLEHLQSAHQQSASGSMLVSLEGSASTGQASQPNSLTSSLTSSSNPLSKLFQSAVSKRSAGSGSLLADEQQQLHQGNTTQTEIQRLRQDLLSLKLHEADSSAELKVLRSREMELETQLKIHENKLRRREQEYQRCDEALRNQLATTSNQVKESQLKLTELEWKAKEEQMMMRLREVEHTRLTGELKQRISSLEVQIEEMNAAAKLAQSGLEPRDATELQERAAELQSESFRLDASNRKLLDVERQNDERERQAQ